MSQATQCQCGRSTGATEGPDPEVEALEALVDPPTRHRTASVERTPSAGLRPPVPDEGSGRPRPDLRLLHRRGGLRQSPLDDRAGLRPVLELAGPRRPALRLRRPPLGPLARLGVVGVAVVALVAATLVWATRWPVPTTAPVGLPAPAFSLPSLAGDAFLGPADLAGRPAVLVFWAPSCQPCVDQLRTVQAAWERYRDQGLAVLGVVVDPRAGPEAAAVVAAQGITFPNVRDPGTVAAAYGVSGVPEAYLLDDRSRVTAADRGQLVGAHPDRGLTLWSPIPAGVLDRRIADLLGKPAG